MYTYRPDVVEKFCLGKMKLCMLAQPAENTHERYENVTETHLGLGRLNVGASDGEARATGRRNPW
jgi:hypothetical protein